MSVRGILCDLDGVVYRGALACPGAVEGLTAAREEGVRVLFMTNNASRPPADVAEHLTSLGLPTAAEDVLGASQVAASVLAQEMPELSGDGGAVLAVGGPGVALALREVGLRPVTPTEVREAAAEDPVRVAAVVQGYGPDVSATDLAEAAYAIAGGALWLATNDDATLPTERGLAPGNGSLVAAVAHATRVTPRVTGKPHAPAYAVALERLGLPLEECLMLGDRLDTDIAGARAVGMASALVLTGVSTREEAQAAEDSSRPDHIGETIPDLAHLWGAR